jgi:hypothetical protein
VSSLNAVVCMAGLWAVLGIGNFIPVRPLATLFLPQGFTCSHPQNGHPVGLVT